jgi:D-serine deaminase-like pyridoxal phosphate-dependent protein
MKKVQLETPALLVDLPVMEGNLRRMAEFFNQGTTKLRPHFKNHKCLALAARQLAAGAIGITCSTVEEAESLVHEGVRSVLIANEIASPAKIDRVAELRRQADVIVCVDNEKIVNIMAIVARNRQTDLHVLVDVDVGLHRCGVPPGEPALRLVRTVIDNGLKFRGLMGYQGHGPRQPPSAETEELCRAAMRALIESRDCIERHGVSVEIVSGGGTGSYSIAGRYPGVTEIQAGSYLFMDTDYRKSCTDFELALSVLTTVVSKTEGSHMVVDAGLKALSSERGMPSVKGIVGVSLRKLNAEHGIIDLHNPSAGLEPGDKIELWVHYSDATVNLNDRIYGIRDGEVEEVLQVERARREGGRVLVWPMPGNMIRGGR